ncbi:MAG: sulfite exporter TauE/SafE family protein [Desertimonas sp.]
MTPAALVAVAAIVALAATVQLAAGFGFGLASVPLLAIVLSPHEAVVVALTLATITNGYQAISGRRSTDWAVLGRLLGGAVAGLPIGLVVYHVTGERVLGVLVGVAVLGAIASIVAGLDLRHAGPGVDIAAGVVSGALTTSVGTNGPPLVFVLQARRFGPEQFRATITSVFFALDVVSSVVFATTGEHTGDVVRSVLVSLPGLLVGAALGVWLRRFLDPVRFRRLVLTVLTVAALSTIVTSLRT